MQCGTIVAALKTGGGPTALGHHRLSLSLFVILVASKSLLPQMGDVVTPFLMTQAWYPVENYSFCVSINFRAACIFIVNTRVYF